jgi:hypothetical protein
MAEQAADWSGQLVAEVVWQRPKLNAIGAHFHSVLTCDTMQLAAACLTGRE